MNEWTRIDIDQHLLNQEALINHADILQTVLINTHEITHRSLMVQLALLLLFCIWIGYNIAPQFLPSKRDIAG